MERVDLGLLMGGYGMGVCAKFTAVHLGCRGGLGRPFPFGAAVLGSRSCWLVSKAKQGDTWISSVLQRSWTACLGSWPEPTSIGKAQLSKEEFAAPLCYWEKKDLENGKRKKKKTTQAFLWVVVWWMSFVKQGSIPIACKSGCVMCSGTTSESISW